MFARSVLITGGNRGIGLGLVKELAAAGKTQHLFVGCRKVSDAEELQALAVEHENLVLLQLDVTDCETVTTSLQKISSIVGTNGLNCLINNAGIIDKFITLEGVSAACLSHLFQTNTIGPAMLTKACLPLIRQASSCTKGDSMAVSRAGVINVSSNLGSLHQNRHGRNYGYRLSKAAMNMMTKNLSIELRHEKVLCVSIHPGWVKTDLGGKKAPLSVEESAKGIISVLSTFKEGDTGSFYGYDGNEVPW